MKHICIITPRYPTSVDKTALTFVQQLAWSMADIGVPVSVICPLPVNLNRAFSSVPDHAEETTYAGGKVKTYFPKYWGFGQKSLGAFNTVFLTKYNFKRAVRRVLAGMTDKPDVLYGHFFPPSGVTACELGDEFGLPAFVAYGESSTWSIDHYGRKRVKESIRNIKGVIAVSTKNKEELAALDIMDSGRIEVFPNGYNPDRFHPIDRREAREKRGLPQDAFIVGFVGHFIKRKGIDVLLEAVNRCDGVSMICAGKGELKPAGERVLFADPVSPDDLAAFYSAADIFVLPTKNEGCCNAIIEAMACGLPVISSDLSFNYDILDESNSILTDPENIQEIAQAITALKNNPDRRNRLAAGSLERSRTLTIDQRAHNILSFIEKNS